MDLLISPQGLALLVWPGAFVKGAALQSCSSEWPAALAFLELMRGNQAGKDLEIYHDSYHGKPLGNHRKTIGKPSENGDLMGF